MSVWRRRLLDWWILYLAPWLPSRLPWRWAYRCYRLFARCQCMYGEPARAATAIAPQYLPISDPVAFAHDVRSVWLLDAVDLALSRGRPPDHLPTHVTVEGDWPEQGPFVAVGFHHAAALWAFHDLRRHGRRAAMVLARLDAQQARSHPVRHRYARARIAELERIGGEPSILRPGVRDRVLAALARGTVVINLLDVPPRLAPRGQHPVPLLGQPASLPVGALELARAAGVPVVPYWIDLDLAGGRRRLVIGAAREVAAVDDVLAELAELLDRLIRTQPAAWHMWHEWPAWLQAAAPLHAPAGTDRAQPSVS